MSFEQHTPLVLSNLDARVGRREAFKIGGLTVSLAALVAACGDDRTGDTAPGRVGNAPKVEALPDYAVNDVVLLRTASSVENTIVLIYETTQELGVFEGEMAALVGRLIEEHQATSDQMGELTEAAGGTAWTSTNPWIMERSIEPMFATILESDNPPRDFVNLAITFANMAAATHQTLTSLLSKTVQRLAVANASAQEARNSATIVLEAYGNARQISPALLGEELINADGLINRYAIETTFGSVAQQDLNLGAADVNGTRTPFVVSTPAANSLIYEELTES